jgi:hypothetical protein
MRFVMVAIGLVASLVALAGAAPPAESDRKSQPTAAATPKEALKRVMLASLTLDPAVVRPLLWTANELESQAADVWAASMTGQFRLREAVRKRFGEEGLKEFTSLKSSPSLKPEEAEAAADERLKDVQVQVDGDRAILTHPSESKPLELRRTPAGWKAVFTNVLGMSSPKLLQNYIKLNAPWGPAHHTTAEEVEKGKYASVAEIKAAVEDRIHPEDAALRGKAAPAQRPANDPRR